MINLTSKTSKSSVLFKRTLTLLCLVVCSIGARGGQWTPKIEASIKYYQSTGVGKVYITSNPNANSTDGGSNANNATEIPTGGKVWSVSASRRSRQSNKTYTFNSVTLHAVEYAGANFDGWYDQSGQILTQNNEYSFTPEVLKAQSDDDPTNYPGPESRSYSFQAKFSIRTYLLRSPAVNIITLDEKGQIIPDDRSGGKVGCAHNNEGVEASSNNHIAQGLVTYPQTADDGGKLGQATFTVWYAAEANDGYEFVGWTKNANATGISSQNARISEEKPSTFEQGTSGTPESTPTYYAVFRRKFIGYNQPHQINISGIGQISVDGSNWKETNITHTPTTMYVSSVTQPTPKIAVMYYAQTKAESNFDFLGWFDEEGTMVSDETRYTYEYTPSAGKVNDLKFPPTLTAKFVPNNFYYKDFAQVVALPDEDGETYLGKVYVDKGDFATNVEGISNWSTQSSVGDEQANPINGYEFTYTYYAKPNDSKSDFKEWVIFKEVTDPVTGSTTITEKVLSDQDVYEYTVDYTNEDWKAGVENAITPPTLYARFQTSRHYYHGRAKVGVASNSEAGQVFVSDVETETPTYYTPTDVQPLYTSQEESVDKDGIAQNNNPNIIETELNQSKYKYYYYAKPSDKAVFKGWTVMPTGDNIVSSKNPYSQEYTASEEPTEVGPMTLYAVFHSYYHTLPRVVSVGSGQVKIIDKTNFQAEINDPTPIPARPDKDDEGKDKDYYTYTYTLTAQADAGATFLGWSTSDSEEDIVSREITYTVNEITSSTSKDAPHRITMYAIFESDIKIKHADRMIYYNVDGNEYINDVNIILEVANAATLKATLTGNTTDFKLANTTLTEQGTSLTVDATASIVPLRLMYVGKDTPLRNAVDKQVNITFTSHDSNGKQLAANGKVVTVEEMPVVTFLPADGKGTYTVSQTDGSGITYTLGEDTDQSVKIDVTHESKSYLQINMTDKEGDGMEFFAWQVIENYGTASEKISYLSYEKIYTHHFTKSVAVRPEFIPETWGRYIIKSNPDVQYFDLNKAIAQAKLGVNVDEKIVVVYRSGLVPKGEYTIPSGVTLLVPGEGPGDAFGSTDYLCQTNGSLTEDDYKTDEYTFSYSNYRCYRKLTIEDGTQLTVAKGGKLCVSARMIVAGQTLNTFPYHYGHIELGNNAVIDVENGATLYAWGYITNPNTQQVTSHNYKEVGRVIAQSGATIWEGFTFTDFRGGSATISFVNLGTLIEYGGGLAGGLVDQLKDANFSGYRHQVFPINQYYVQCIEAPLVLSSGATENLSTAIFVDGSTSTTSAVLVGNEAGLFQWQSATVTLTKYYDAATDRTKYIVEDTQNANSSIKLGNIGLKLSVFGQAVDIKSQDYIMPIHNSMDISIKNALLNVPSGINLAFLAGSSIHVDKNSKIKNDAQCYIYDKDQNVFEGYTTGYFGSGDAQILPIKARPYPEVSKLFTTPTYSSLTNLQKGQPNPNVGDAYKVSSLVYVWSGIEWVQAYALKVKRDANSITDATLIVDGSVDCSNGYLITTKGGANITSNGGGKIVVKNFGKPSSGSGTSLKRNQGAFQYNQQSDGSGALGVGYHAIPLATNNNTYYPRLHNSDDSYTEAMTANTYYYCGGRWGTDVCTEEPNVELDYTPRFAVTAPVLAGYVGEGIVKKAMPFELLNANLQQSDWSTVQWEATFTGRDANLFEFNKEQNPAVSFRPASEGVKNAVMILTATYTHPTTSVKYVYSKAVDLTATAREQIANTLAFANVDALYIGQLTTALLVNGNNTNKVQITVSKDGVVTTNNDVLWSQATIHADAEGEVIITVTQAADNTNHIAGITLTKKVKVTDRVVWNWSTLYYPSINTNPITIKDGSTEDWTLTEVIDKESGDVVQFRGNGSVGGAPDTYEAEIYDLINGKYKVYFDFKRGGETLRFTSEIFYDPRELRVDVNNDTVYNGITVGAAEGIEFNKNRKTVTIVSTPQQANAWTIHFLGIPDKLYFEPVDSPNAWQIEESTNGKTWTTTMPWTFLTQNKPFEYSLMPTTQYVRISYGANGNGVMRDVYITKLEGVKFSPEKVYMPVEIDGNDQLITHSREVAITYVSSKDVSVTSATAGEFTFNKSSFGATTSNPFYKVEKLVITNATCREEKLTGVNVTSSIGTEVIPVQTFFYPQELPIVLASDMPAERYHYVTTQSYRTTWDEETRTIYMDNAVANAEPFVVFHYDGAPSYISFDHNADANAEWIIEESTDGINWTTASATPETSATSIKQPVEPTTTYIRVAYSSLHAKRVAITNLMIIGEEGAFVNPTELTVEYIAADNRSKDFTVTAINLTSGMIVSTDNANFTLTQGTSEEQPTITLTSGQDGLKEMAFNVYFNGSSAVDYTTITVTNYPVAGKETKVLATIKVTGIRKTLTNGDINICTGVPDGTDGAGANVGATEYTIIGSFEGSKYRRLNIDNAFANNVALFDYLFIFDETTTTDATTIISKPTTIVGSNAKTPCYIYKKNGNGDAYEFYTLVENANAGTKITQDFLRLTDPEAETLKVYITGFCPYASTGYTKQDEGVFFFRGGAGDNVHVYLQDCYIFSRSKTEDGHYFEGRSDGQAFTDNYVQGSGGVLVFECSDKANANGQAFNVTIHTRDSSMFKSHYGCFLESVAGRAYQVSAPVQVHMQSSDFVTGSYTVLNFDDIWPNAETGANERTNGFISLQKQVNNAPSIDLGNANTVVNFNGGQVQLQNACNSSDNYNSTLAISYRGGRFAGFLLAYGLGSDEVTGTGTVNFNDGTTTVLTMDVPERYRQYYLMDENGTSTSCLRTPKNTYVFGGSHCMMRACEAATSKGGAPTDGKSALGKFEYKDAYSDPASHPYGLVTPTNFPTQCYLDYYATVEGYPTNAESKKCYGLQSIAPVDGAINLWLPVLDCDDAFDVEPEKDQTISFWKACMTEIGASYGGYGGNVGGDVEISFKNGNQEELVSNLLYCKIDATIQGVISQPSYQAPVKSPMPQGDPYLYVTPTTVGDKMQHYVTNAKPYQIENKVYYITTATADVWQTFTAPFDVENIYVMEAYPEAKLEEYASTVSAGTNVRDAVMTLQARYNAHFASFFGVAMCIHPNKTFDMIYSDFNTWARQEYASTEFGKQPIIPFNGSNWNDANAYIFHNDTESNWELGWDMEENPTYNPNWERVEGQTDGAIMHQGETYSMLFPYCIGCWEKDGDGNVKDRTYWDYWSGKFIIFESTDGPHQINGTDFIAATDVNPSNAGDWVLEGMNPSATEAILTGNSTLAKMTTTNGKIFYYDAAPGEEYFYPTYASETGIEPTTAFLMATPPTNAYGMPARSIGRTGKITYDNDGTTTGGNIPTVGGGNDLFITSTATGINIAVAQPQQVRVMSATGAIIFSGMVQTAVDVTLPTTGVYVVAGENEVHKILY